MFEIKGNALAGYWIEVASERLTTASLYGPDIESQVAALKSDLDTVAKQMKAKLENPKQSLFGTDTGEH